MLRSFNLTFIAGWLILGGWTPLFGQIELSDELEAVTDGPSLGLESEDDRYGGFSPVSLEDHGPARIVQAAPAAPPTVNSPAMPPLQLQPSGPVSLPPVIYYESIPAPMVSGPMPGEYAGCPPWRPCGPSESFGGNWLFKQTFAGADFRPACARHDACLAAGCTGRKCCDKMFLWELDRACDCSAFPVLCRLKAREYYLGVRLFGWLWY